MGLDALSAHPMLTRLKLSVLLDQAADVTELLVCKVLLVDHLSAHHNWWFATLDSTGYLLLSLNFLRSHCHLEFVYEAAEPREHLFVVPFECLRLSTDGLLNHLLQLSKHLDSLLVESTHPLKERLYSLVVPLVLQSLDSSVETRNDAHNWVEELVHRGTVAEHLA